VLSTQRMLRLPVAVLALGASIAVVPATAFGSDAVSREVAKRINVLRARNGLRPLVLDGRLERAGRSQSSAMMSRRSLSHGKPDGKVRLTRLCQKMNAKTIGETIGWIRYRSPRKQAAGIVRWWMRSPPHRAALMSPTFSRIGVGRRTGQWGRAKVVWFSADLSG
jgi:uncharacterized protein YkwD